MEGRFHSTVKQHVELRSNFDPAGNSVNVPLDYTLFLDLLTNRITQLGTSVSTIYFTSDDILKMIKNLDSNKAHGHDMITIRMIKLCDASICKPLELIFKSCLENGKKIMWFQHTMKEKYLPISLLPVVEKIFERILYNNIYEFFTQNNLISPNQSGFKPDDLCINQLLSITHEICKP